MLTSSVSESAPDGADSLPTECPNDNVDGLIEPRTIAVLVIEDSDNDFRITSRTLQLMDTYRAEVRHAPDLVAARSLVQERQFDVILVDFCLGLDTGTRAIQELGGRIGSAALILLTGLPGQDIRQIALKAGAIHCLDKNQLNPALLETTIRSALHTHQLEAKLQDVIVDLERANRAKADFFARMGHDLKTPLNAILGYAQMISDQIYGADASERYADCANNVCTAGTHLLEVLDNLIHHAANQGSYSGGRFQSADLNDLVERAVEIASILARSRKHSVSVKLSADLVPVDCQPSVLTQAILNVISNAVKYTPPGGQIEILVSQNDRFREVSVRDNGLGMSKDDIDVALSPFGRVTLPPMHTQDGTGIGLPIVRDIMASHGGQLDIESAPGDGTLVTLRWPKPDAEQNAA